MDKEKQKLYILFGIGAVAFLVIYFNLLLKPMFSGFIVKNREYIALSAKVKSAKILIANEAGIRRQHENIKEQAGYLKKRLPSQNQVSSLLEDFSSVAESSGVKILRLKPLEDAAAGNKTKPAVAAVYSEFPILIEARAGYHQLGDFVNKLENMERFIKITDIDIRGNSQDSRRHEIKMRMVTYVLR